METVTKRYSAFGYGASCGDGNGYGYGGGVGYGYGANDGCGYGASCGEWNGNGYGCGAGSGYGSSDGCGYGADYSADIKAFCGQLVYDMDGVKTLIDRVHGSIARGRVLLSDLTTAPCYIAKGGNHFAHGETIGEAMAALDSKLYEDMPVEERLAEFKAKFPPKTLHPAMDYYVWHNRLTGSCEMGRNEFVRERCIDLAHDVLTPEGFIRLTLNSFGGSVIRQLMPYYGMEEINEQANDHR